jgi:hypothetical protein
MVVAVDWLKRSEKGRDIELASVIVCDVEEVKGYKMS